MEKIEPTREKCKYPMSKFYIYVDEIPENVRISGCEDCIKCDDMACCQDGNDGRHCLITDTQLQRNCFNHCPKCDATNPNIEWREKEWSGLSAWQNATCNKCGCEFWEVYEYKISEIDK